MVGTPPGWLLLPDVKDQLRIDGDDATDDTLITRAIGAAEIEVGRARPDAAADPAGHQDVYLAGVMLAARLVRRRNSPAGIESFGDSVSFVASFDPDMDRFLRRGRYRFPGVG